MKETNRLNDIDGAHSGSLKKCPQTKRNINPLTPIYQYLGEKELVDANN